MTTPTTPGAASELLPCSMCGCELVPHERHPEFLTHPFSKRQCWLYSAMVDPANAEHVASWNTRTPAPVQVKPVDRGSASDSTKESSREAVAWRDITDWQPMIDRAYERICAVQEWHEFTGWLADDVFKAMLHMAFDTAQNMVAPPPPDRVQTRNPESSIAQPERVEAVALELAPLEPKPACWIDGADIGHLADGAVEHVYAYAKQILPCMVPVFAAPPTDASGGVTDAMVQAAAEAYLGHKNGPHSRVPRDAMRAALEAADRARKNEK